MKINGVNKLYTEGFENGIMALCNIEDSCERFFNSKHFQDVVDNKIMSTKLNYDEENDCMKVSVDMFIDIPILDRVDEKILCDYYRKIRYTATYVEAKLIEECVEILD